MRAGIMLSTHTPRLLPHGSARNAHFLANALPRAARASYRSNAWRGIIGWHALATRKQANGMARRKNQRKAAAASVSTALHGI